MKTYRGIRTPERCLVEVYIGIDGHFEVDTYHELDPRLDLRNHSPTGFEWGYGGSGPAQLALAILADHLNVPKAKEGSWVPFQHYQQFKFDVISKLPKDEWTITSDEIERWLKEKGTAQ